MFLDYFSKVRLQLICIENIYLFNRVDGIKKKKKIANMIVFLKLSQDYTLLVWKFLKSIIAYNKWKGFVLKENISTFMYIVKSQNK